MRALLPAASLSFCLLLPALPMTACSKSKGTDVGSEVTRHNWKAPSTSPHKSDERYTAAPAAADATPGVPEEAASAAQASRSASGVNNSTVAINQVVPVGDDGVTTSLAAGSVVVAPMIAQFNNCASQGKIWLPPPDNLTADLLGVCGDPLLPWACTPGALAAMIPSYQAPLAAVFTQLESRGFQIYGGSAPADGSLNINMIALQGSSLLWHQVNITVSALTGLASSILSTTGSPTPCENVFASVVSGVSTGTSSGTTTAPSFTPINTLLTANCGGASCHGAGASPQLVLVGNPSVVQAQAQAMISQLNAGLMPLGTTMNAADKANLISLLQAY